MRLKLISLFCFVVFLSCSKDIQEKNNNPEFPLEFEYSHIERGTSKYYIYEGNGLRPIDVSGTFMYFESIWADIFDFFETDYPRITNITLIDEEDANMVWKDSLEDVVFDTIFPYNLDEPILSIVYDSMIPFNYDFVFTSYEEPLKIIMLTTAKSEEWNNSGLYQMGGLSSEPTYELNEETATLNLIQSLALEPGDTLAVNFSSILYQVR